MKNVYYKKQKGSEDVANDVMKNGILLGCHHGMKTNELKYMCNTFNRLI